MSLHNLLDKLIKYIDDHRTAFDLSVGGSIGFLTGLEHWWEHFTQPEVLYNFYDGVFSTAVHTLLGACLLYVLRRFVFKSKGDESKNN